jgi:hypothetical protein
MGRIDLERLSKEELIELVLKLQRPATPWVITRPVRDNRRAVRMPPLRA